MLKAVWGAKATPEKILMKKLVTQKSVWCEFLVGFTEASEGDQCVFSNKLHIGDGGIFNVESLHCINSELYLAKWKWILRSGPKLKMLVKFQCSNGSFPNPLNWWRIRFGLICCWRTTFTTDTLGSHPPPSPRPNIKETVLCIQGDWTSHHQITKLHLWPLDHSSSDVWRERERLNINYKLGYCWLSLRHFYKPKCQSQKANNAGRKPPVYIDKKIQHISASTMPLIIKFFMKIKTLFGSFWGQTRIIILSLP